MTSADRDIIVGMCGRYTLRKAEERELGIRFDVEEFCETRLTPRFNIAPTQDVPVIIREDGRIRLEVFKWGLIPCWAKDLKKSKPMINSRIETIAEKPYFKGALKNKRCLIPADGFYEWRVDVATGRKIPTFIHLKNSRLFAFAGLWDRWTSPDGEVIRSCSIITMPANDFMSPIHERMPAILPMVNEKAWLDPRENDAARLLSLLAPISSSDLVCYPVSTVVNSPKTDAPECAVELTAV